MKYKIIKPDKDIELEIQGKNCERKLSCSEEEINVIEARIGNLACELISSADAASFFSPYSSSSITTSVSPFFTC